MRKLMLLLAFLVCVAPAWAQRALPADAKRGQIGERQGLPMVQIGNETRRLAEVLYVLGRNDEVLRIIVLTPEEQARLDRKN
jgi:hypothetical protein